MERITAFGRSGRSPNASRPAPAAAGRLERAHPADARARGGRRPVPDGSVEPQGPAGGDGRGPPQERMTPTPRGQPMITDLTAGWISLDGVRLQPFPGWPGGFRFAETPTRAYVGAGEGGGARYCVYERASRRKLKDEFADGDTVSRGGVHFVVAETDPITRGTGFPLYLLFERPYPGTWLADVVERVAVLFAGCGVQVTTERPDRAPGDYGTVVVGARLSWAGVVGTAPVDRFGIAADVYTYPQQVYTTAFLNYQQTAVSIAHEGGHGFGRPHVKDAGNVMNETPFPGATLSDADRAAIRVRTAVYQGKHPGHR